MKVGFLGLGKLGLPMAMGIKLCGYDVCGYDINQDRMNPLWFKEKEVNHMGQQLKDVLQKEAYRIEYKSSEKEVLDSSAIVFVTVQTPNASGWEGSTVLPQLRTDYNLEHLMFILKRIAEYNYSGIVVIVSTVLPRTHMDRLEAIFVNTKASVVHNPAFCAMGTVIPDLMNPEFVLLGSSDHVALSEMKRFYKTIVREGTPIIVTTTINAEIIKTCYNAFITMKINYANMLMEICHRVGGNIDVVMSTLQCANKRLISPKYMNGGMGDGGGCHPKENISLSYFAKKYSLSYDMFEFNLQVREKQAIWLSKLVIDWSLTYHYPILILGYAFKKDTDITEGSAALLIKSIICDMGHEVKIWDSYVSEKDTLETLGKSVV